MTIKQNLTILQVNDSHAYLEPHQELFWDGYQAVYRRAGGFARMAALINRIRAESPGGVLTFDGGDMIHGTYAAVKSQGEALIPILNTMHFDAMTAHWEFAYGPEQLKRVTEQLSYPLLACNVYDQASHELVFPPFTICETDGLRIGIIGIAATIVEEETVRLGDTKRTA